MSDTAKQERIWNKTYEHHKEIERNVTSDGSKAYNLFGTILVGSQNYEIDTEESDIDTKAIILPSVAEIALNKKPISTTKHLANGEQITLVDYRLWIEQFLKQNINTLECLFAKASIINRDYMPIWDEILSYREYIAHLNINKVLCAAHGIATRRYNYVEAKYPSNEALIDKFGYDPKSLANMFRVKDFMERYISGEPFRNCIIPKDKEHIIEIKKGNVYTAEQAHYEKEKLRLEMEKLVDKRNDKKIEAYLAELYPTTGILELMDEWRVEILKQCLGVK